VSPLDDVAAWIGTWRGEGDGSYPTIDSFHYTEELVLAQIPGRPMVAWSSRARDSAGQPRHAESGFLRLGDEGVELVLAHNFGTVEVAVGRFGAEFDGSRLDLDTHAMSRTPSAKVIDLIRRRYALDGDTIGYEIAMAAVGVPLTHHLRATLTRVG
jgi:THAP4-like, heme-binding beta-barrel domain